MKPKIINLAPELVAVARLKPHPKNARQGDEGAIYASIRANGFYGRLIVQKSTGYILVGNHRFRAGLRAGMTEFPVEWVDCDDDRALRILLADNKTADDASYNDVALGQILADLANSSLELDGTGYSLDDLDDLITKTTGAPSMDSGKPRTPRSAGETRLGVIVDCSDEMDQETVCEAVRDAGFIPRKATLNERTEVRGGGRKRGHSAK